MGGWLHGGFKKWAHGHMGGLIGSLLLPGVGTLLGSAYDKQQKNFLLSQQKADNNQKISNALTLQEIENQNQANAEARAEALQERKEKIDSQRKQLLGNQRKSYSSGNNVFSSNGFSLLDNGKRLG